MTDKQIENAINAIKAEIARNTAVSRKRAETMTRYLQNAANDCGAYGRVMELSAHTTYSRKSRVAVQGKADTFIRFRNADGKIYNRAVEVKTNGGRIESLYAKNAPRFVVYSLDFAQKHKASKKHAEYVEERHIDAVVIPTDLFLSFLESNGLIKSTNGRNPEKAIQVSSKVLYNALLDYPIAYNPNAVYCADDFDGLTL